MRTEYLCHLATHIPVEIGDIVQVPGNLPHGAPGEIGVIVRLNQHEVALGMPPDAPTGNLVMSLSGAGIVSMDTVFVRPRPSPERPVRHLIP